MKRSELKNIVKECLVELLADGLESTGKNISESRRSREKNNVLLEEKRLATHRQKLDARVSDTVSSVTDDPILQDILAHTARTTLQEQISNDQQTNSDNLLLNDQPTSVAGVNLDSIFAAPSKNWAEMAFANKKSS